MNDQTKKQIADALRAYCERKGSQNKAANSLKGVSAATVSHVLSGDWGLIKSEMWRSISAQIGYKPDGWRAVETRDYKLLTGLLADAQENALVMAITGDAGTGKTFAMRRYCDSHANAYLLQCAEFWNKKMFLQELLSAMGRDYSGYSIGEMMYECVSELKKQDSPMLLLDEGDKLSDCVLQFFITLYNQLEGGCAIILCATSHLCKRLKRGVKLNKRGYNEIFSRVGRKCIELKGLGASDVAAVCRANGVEDGELIREVVEDCEGDMRRVRRKIHALTSAKY
ncbi:MAG: ATP-binding protein [Prevotellaceae bacterium]|jgi:DNA transposition AAA+ family ATPase|nr:ATP-binding protein [Prevotellaceae bacterium]